MRAIKDSQSSSLIIIAMQNAFCSPKGSYQVRLKNKGKFILNLNIVIDTIKSLLDLARSYEWLVIFTKLQYTSNYENAGLLVKSISPEILNLGGYKEGTWDSEIIRDLQPQKNEIVLKKKRYDPFEGTDLENILITNNIGRVIVTGLLTNVCVESCVRSAFDKDFEVIIIREATSTYSKQLYEGALLTIGSHFGKVINYRDFVNNCRL